MAGFIGLALRDKADFVSGDFIQAGGYLEECVYHAVKFYEFVLDLTLGSVQWDLPGPVCEIRTVICNWPLKVRNITCGVKNKGISVVPV